MVGATGAGAGLALDEADADVDVDADADADDGADADAGSEPATFTGSTPSTGGRRRIASVSGNIVTSVKAANAR